MAFAEPGRRGYLNRAAARSGITAWPSSPKYRPFTVFLGPDMNEMLESRLLETHFDVIPFDIYVVDVATMEIVFINRHYRDRLGNLTGLTCHEALYGFGQPCHFCKINSLLDTDGAPNGEVRIFELFNEKDDRWRQLQEKTLSWPDGRVVKYSIAVDITELKATQNRLAEAHAQLALRNKELRDRNVTLEENVRLREHVDRMSRHDLKGPLSAVINLPQLILECGELPPDCVQMLRVIRDAGLTMLNMLNQSLDLYRLEAGTYLLKPLPVDLVQVARHATAALAGLAEQRCQSVRILLRGAPPLGQETLYTIGEALLCQTMLMNLVKNALEASPDGGEVAVELDEAEGRALVAVENVGELLPGVRERFFEKYVTAGKFGGTGLGTYSVRLTAEAHGGTAALDLSRPGRVRVVVALPLAPSEPGAELSRECRPRD